jgi:hypothetical protein
MSSILIPSLLGAFGSSTKFVTKKSDFGTPDGSGVYLLEDEHVYYLMNSVDLEGGRLVFGENTALIGPSSENSILSSTGLVEALISTTTTTSIVIRDITLTSDLVLDIDGGVGITLAIDWQGVNFTNCAVIGTAKNVNNFIFSRGAFINSAGFTFDGTCATIGFADCLFVGLASATTFIFPATLTVTRRIRIIYSSFVNGAPTSVGIDLSVSATVPTESYILDTCNFAGGGTFITGVTSLTNEALFVNNVGITNTAVNGQIYMQSNATPTTISDTTSFFKVSGTTTASPDNEKYIGSTTNRLTNDAEIQRKFLIICSLSFDTTNNNVCQFGFYDSKLSIVRIPSKTLATANASGRNESVSMQCVVSHEQGDYLEIHCRNTTGTNNITVTDMNFTVTELGN